MTFGSKLAVVPGDFSIGKVNQFKLFLFFIHFLSLRLFNGV